MKTILFQINLLFLGFTCLYFVSCSTKVETSTELSVKVYNYPVLKGNATTPIIQICYDCNSAQSEVNEISFYLSGESNLKSMAVFYSGSDSLFNSELVFGKVDVINEQVVFKGQQNLQQGKNFFWLTVEADENANLNAKFSVGLDYLGVDSKKLAAATAEDESILRTGIALRKHGDDNVDTYRIPGLVTTNNGTLIAVYDIRRNSSVDLQEDIDVGMNRNTDGGKTWSPMQVIMDMKEWGSLPDEQNGIGDPCVFVDKETNTIWVAAVWAHGHPGERNWWASQPGIKPEKTSQLILVKSEDDGKTWSEPINITPQVKQKNWYLLLQGPGKGITMTDGTLVFPAQFKDEEQMPHSTIIWSKDHGESWNIGTGAKSNTTEAQVIERNDGSLMLNMRDNRNRTDNSESNGRSVYITNNLGKNWEKHATSRTNVLQESTCQASLIKDDFIVNGEKKSLVLFSNPNTKSGRHHMTIKASFDDGETWPEDYQLLIDEGAGRGYSCMTKIDDSHIGILYEGSQADMTFQIIDVNDVVE